VIETPFFFDLGADRLFAVLHRPARGQPRQGIVLCHALGEERLWSHRVYVNLGRDLARRGMALLRFDFRGEGDSDLEFEQTGLATRLEDAMRAAAVLLERAPGLSGVIYLGHRLGAAVAAAAAAASERATGLVAWDPLPSGREYLMQLLRSTVASQMSIAGKATSRTQLLRALDAGGTVFVDGYGIGPALYRDLIGMEWPRLIDGVRCPRLLVEGACEPAFWRDSKRLYTRAPSMTERSLQWLEARPA
jgi:alpha/beta superfamily hydrolase